MPQFNWSIFGPIVLVMAAILGSAAFLASQISDHAAQMARPGVVSAVSTVTLPPPSRLSTPPGGVRLSGRVVGTPHLRAEPSSTAAVLHDLQSGEPVDVTACSPSCGWYLITATGDSSPGWVSAAFISIQGDDSKLPVIGNRQ